MDEQEFKNNLDLQKRFTELISKAIRDINTDSAFTAEQKRDLIKQLGGAPKHLMFEFLNSQYRSGPEIAKNIKALISEDRPRHTERTNRTPNEILNEVKELNTPKKNG